MADFKKLKDGQGNSYIVKDETARTNLASHTGNTSNPHSVTKAQVGLGNVDNTSDANKPISNAQAAVNATKFDKANVKSTPASTPSNDNVVSEKYSEETYAKKDGYYETFGYAREAGIASNLKNDEGKLLDPDVEASSGTVYADQPFTQRATAMTMKAYLDNELITVGSGYEQWKKEQAFSIVRNQLAKGINSTFTKDGITVTNNNDGSVTLNGTNTSETDTVDYPIIYGDQIQYTNGHKYLLGSSSGYDSSKIEYFISNMGSYVTIEGLGIKQPSQTVTGGFSLQIKKGATFNNVKIRPVVIDLTQWFASRPEIATALNGDAGIKWFLQNYPQATTLGYDEGTIVDTEDYEYQTTGVNLWDEEWEVGAIGSNGLELISDSIRSKNFSMAFPNTTYYSNSNLIRMCYYDKDFNFLYRDTSPGYTHVTPNNCYYFKITLADAYGPTYKHDIQICQHFTETSVENTYHPYEIYKDKVSWAFTSTGKGKSAGKVADTKDYVNKKNIEKVGSVDLGTLNWSTDNIYFNSQSSTKIPNPKIPATNVAFNGICSIYQTIALSPLNSSTDMRIAMTGSGNLYIRDSSKESLSPEAFKAAMSGVILNYELETPIETDMTGDELDTNIPENDYGVERKVPLSGNMFSGSSTTIFYQDNVLRQIYNNKTAIDNLQGKVSAEETTRSDTDIALQNAIGGTLRQCLCVKANLDFDNTDFVDLGTLDFNYDSSNAYFNSNGISSLINKPTANSSIANIVCSKYNAATWNNTAPISTGVNLTIGVNAATGNIGIRDTSYTDATTFKNAMKGVLLAYEKGV